MGSEMHAAGVHLLFEHIGASSLSGVGGGQVMGEAVGTHLPLLVGENAKVAASHRAAEKDEAGGLVFGEVRVGTVVFNAAFEQTSGTGEAAALAADDGKVDSVSSGGVEDVLGGAASDGAGAFGCFEDHLKAPLLGHMRLDAPDYGL
jgi:hypothetical protein